MSTTLTKIISFVINIVKFGHDGSWGRAGDHGSGIGVGAGGCGFGGGGGGGGGSSDDEDGDHERWTIMKP